MTSTQGLSTYFFLSLHTFIKFCVLRNVGIDRNTFIKFCVLGNVGIDRNTFIKFCVLRNVGIDRNTFQRPDFILFYSK